MGKVRSEKMFVCGLDGMDPRLTKKYVEMGIMPNTKKFIEAGAQRVTAAARSPVLKCSAR